MLFHRSPNYKKLKTFGCLCYPWLRPYSTSKLQPRSIPCIFLGYSTSQSAYKCLDRQTRRLYLSHHVKFVEEIFPNQGRNKSHDFPTRVRGACVTESPQAHHPIDSSLTTTIFSPPSPVPLLSLPHISPCLDASATNPSPSPIPESSSIISSSSSTTPTPSSFSYPSPQISPSLSSSPPSTSPRPARVRKPNPNYTVPII